MNVYRKQQEDKREKYQEYHETVIKIYCYEEDCLINNEFYRPKKLRNF